MMPAEFSNRSALHLAGKPDPETNPVPGRMALECPSHRILRDSIAIHLARLTSVACAMAMICASGSLRAGVVSVDGDTLPLVPVSPIWDLSGDPLFIGDSRAGSLTIGDGGRVTSFAGLIGLGPGSTGTATIQGVDSTWINLNELYVGVAGIGTLTIESGGIVSGGNFSYIGSARGSTGSATVSGTNSAWTALNLIVGDSGNGTLSIDSGGSVFATSVILARQGSGRGSLSIRENGTLSANIISKENGTSGATMDLDGGVLRATQDEPNYLRNFQPGDVTLLSGGLTFDTQSHSVGISAPLDGVGGLTKIGSGTLTLSGANTYSGTTTVNSGKLLQGAPGAFPANAPYAVNGGELDLNGFDLAASSLSGSGGRITLGSATLTVNGAGESEYAGEISGSGSLNKAGRGSLKLTGALSYTGETTISEGALVVDGSIASTQISVGANGILGGRGTIGGNVTSLGVVDPGNSPGTLTINGNFQQQAAGELRIEIAGLGAGEHDLLEIGGTASLNGALRLIRLDDFKLRKGDRIVFLTADGGVSGKFSRVNNAFQTGTAISGKVVYDENSVSLVGVQESFANVPELIRDQFSEVDGFSFPRDLTPNQSAVAHALDELVFADDHNRRSRELVDFLNERLLPQLPGDFDAIAPEELTSIYTIANSLSDVQGINLQRRTSGLRSGSMGFNASGFAMNGAAPSQSGSLAGSDSLTGAKKGTDSKDAIVAPTSDPRWGAFLSGTGEWIGVEHDYNASGYDIATGGVTLGLDYRVTPNLVVGVSAGYAGTSADLIDGGRLRVNGGELGLYATYYTGGFYADLAVRGGFSSYDTKRAALGDSARGSTEGGQFSTLVGIGYDFQFGAFKIGPVATFSSTYVGIEGFEEDGSLAPLDFPEQSSTSVRSSLGVKASYEGRIGRLPIQTELRAAWQHEYGDATYTLDSEFSSSSGTMFTVYGPRVGRDSLLVGASVTVQCSERAAVYVAYDAQLLRERYESHAVTAAFRIAF